MYPSQLERRYEVPIEVDLDVLARKVTRAVTRLSALARRLAARADRKLLAWMQEHAPGALDALLDAGRRLNRRADARGYLREVRTENRRRGIQAGAHRVRRDTPIRFTWQSIQLSVLAEKMGSDRFRLGLTS